MNVESRMVRAAAFSRLCGDAGALPFGGRRDGRALLRTCRALFVSSRLFRAEIVAKPFINQGLVRFLSRAAATHSFTDDSFGIQSRGSLFGGLDARQAGDAHLRLQLAHH